jgi:hypothetical protein
MHSKLRWMPALSVGLVAMAYAVDAAAERSSRKSTPERQTTLVAYAILADAELLLTGAESIEIVAPSGERLICRTEATMRSHIPRRRCFTGTQLDRIMREAQEWMRSGGRYGSVYTTR